MSAVCRVRTVRGLPVPSGPAVGVFAKVRSSTSCSSARCTLDMVILGQEGKKRTDAINRRSPRKYAKIWEVGGKTETQKI